MKKMIVLTSLAVAAAAAAGFGISRLIAKKRAANCEEYDADLDYYTPVDSEVVPQETAQETHPLEDGVTQEGQLNDNEPDLDTVPAAQNDCQEEKDNKQ